jgi:hypothetical protein
MRSLRKALIDLILGTSRISLQSRAFAQHWAQCPDSAIPAVWRFVKFPFHDFVTGYQLASPLNEQKQKLHGDARQL